MSEFVTFQVHGLKELEANLKKLREQFDVKTGGVIIRGLRAGAKLIVADAKRRVRTVPSGFAPLFAQDRAAAARSAKPRRGRKRKSNINSLESLLRANIVEHAIPTSSALAGGRPTVIVRVRNRGYERRGGKLRFTSPGTSPGWWWWLEFGTSRTPARPFLRPAAESQKGAAVMAMKARMAKEIDATFKKHRR